MSSEEDQGWRAELEASDPHHTPGANYRRLARTLAREAEGLSPLRLTLLTSYTSTFWDDFLRVEFARRGYGVEISRGSFGEFETFLSRRDEQADDGGAAEALVVHIRPADLSPDSVARFYREDGSPSAIFDDVHDRLEACIGLYRSRTGKGSVFLGTHETPWPAPLGILDATNPASMTHLVGAANRALAQLAADRSGVYLWDYAGLVATHGASKWTDERMFALARAPVAERNLPHLAAHLAGTYRAAMRPGHKCLVLDLDHTLWGGAVGDDGLEGIVLSDDFPGSAYKRVQRVALGLRDRGVVLAICSKNDEAVALDAMTRHPEMLIRPEHVAVHEIGWGPKSAGLKRIAETLNIGLDAVAFLDDNPVERAEVRANAPEVHVIEPPSDPVLFARALELDEGFATGRITDEDRQRAQAYQSNAKRDSAKAVAETPEAFLRSLEMLATVGDFDEATSDRISQLVGKTNQFNLTTRRHPPGALTSFAKSDDSAVLWLRLSDKYGELGLTAVGVVVRSDEEALVDSLIMSCRVANRGVEQAMVSALADRARALGCAVLVGEFIPTERNHVVADLYERLGFTRRSHQEDGVERFELDLTSVDVPWPPEITRLEG